MVKASLCDRGAFAVDQLRQLTPWIPQYQIAVGVGWTGLYGGDVFFSCLVTV